MVFIDWLKMLWSGIIRAAQIEKNQQILNCQNELFEKQKKIEGLEIENKRLNKEIEVQRSFVASRQFKQIDQWKNSCK